MCLTIATPPVTNYAYKVYALASKPARGYTYGVKSTYKGNVYNIKEGEQVIKSDRKSKTLTAIERREGKVHHGIHVYTDLDGAMIDFSSNSPQNRILAIVRLIVDPKDLVATGEFANRGSAVYTKVTFNRVLIRNHGGNVRFN